MRDEPPKPSAPPIEPDQVARALRATLPEDEAEALVGPLEAGQGWLPLSPGLNPVSLAIAVTSPAFAMWLRSTLQSADELEVVARIQSLPEERALREIRDGLWDPPYP